MHCLRIREGDEWKTAFNTPLGHFEYLVMPMVNDVLRDFVNRCVFVYLDDILIFSRSLDDHVQQVRCVLQWLLENKLLVKAEKCVFKCGVSVLFGLRTGKGTAQSRPL